jgi:hypothetical protein
VALNMVLFLTPSTCLHGKNQGSNFDIKCKQSPTNYLVSVFNIERHLLPLELDQEFYFIKHSCLKVEDSIFYLT